MGELKNRFSWSKSRDEMFSTCLRRYYYNYYAFWNGWRSDAPEPVRRIYVLKQLSTRQMWAGNKVHECIADSLQKLRHGIALPEPEKVVAITIDKMRAEFRSSREKNYWRFPKSCALFEHEYDIDLPDSAWQKNAEVVRISLHNFFRSPTYAKLSELPANQWLETEEFSAFDLEGTRVMVVLDCSFRTDEGITIIDWKTGRSMEGEKSVQLSCYALYAHQKWGLALDRIRLLEYNLPEDLCVPHQVAHSDLEGTKRYIRASISGMHALLQEPTLNKPRQEEDFLLTPLERECGWCNFRRICPKTNQDPAQ